MRVPVDPDHRFRRKPITDSDVIDMPESVIDSAGIRTLIRVVVESRAQPA